MNEEKILTFALREALNVWSKCKDRADSIPEIKLQHIRNKKHGMTCCSLKKCLYPLLQKNKLLSMLLAG